MHTTIILAVLLGCALLPAAGKGGVGADRDAERRADSLVARMTLEEKIGQCVQFAFREKSRRDSTTIDPLLEAEIRKGQVGSLLNAIGADLTRRVQRVAVEESRMGIPLLFGLDVVHGFRTVFPIPLAEASTWDPDLIRRASRLAAREAAAAGIHWTFAPMVDIARDPRWGRIAEGAGEDPYLGSQMAAARVLGFQGDSLGDPTAILACAKHFAAYGGAEGGRDYNTVDISERTLREVYLPPFEAAVRAGAGTLMASFNEIGGVPSSGNPHLLNDILRGEWGFDGFVVSDWNSIGELRNHGFAGDSAEAALRAVTAGVDMDMEGRAYRDHLARLVRTGKLDSGVVERAARRVLLAKIRMGLFARPYRAAGPEGEAKSDLPVDHRALARTVAQRSIVLLKNDGDLLPLRRDLRSVAVIGPLAEDRTSILGPWDAVGRAEDAVSPLAGIRAAVGTETVVVTARGCEVEGSSTALFAEALGAARNAEVVIAVVGETSEMSGEAASRSSLGLPGIQEHLVDTLAATGKPLVVVLMNGRPLAIPGIHRRVPAIVESWFLGVEGGNALADVLFGAVNPSGKLPVTFPQSVGQVPLYYNHKNTGRPPSDTDKYTSKYIDGPSVPLYPFGYGLSYTRFTYSNLRTAKPTITPAESLAVSVEVENVGSRAGEEVVQLYVRDLAGSVTRPVQELRGFARVLLQPGRKQTVTILLTPESFSMYDARMRKVVEPGQFEVKIGGNSRDVLTAPVEVIGP